MKLCGQMGEVGSPQAASSSYGGAQDEGIERKEPTALVEV
jgi:hypothetical protein